MDSMNVTPLSAGQFRRGILQIVVAALILDPVSGIVIMTFVGIYPWPQLLYVLIEYSAFFIALNVIGILWFTRRTLDRVVTVVEHGTTEQRDQLEIQLKNYLPIIFFGFLFLYTVQGAFSANLSLSHFHGYQYDLKFYFYTLYGIIPTFLITTFPIYFYLTDYMGRYLAPKGVNITVAPLGLKLGILGLFTPLMIDTVLLLYYYDRTHFLTFETILLWFVLLVIASLGTIVAWRSLKQSLAPFNKFITSMERDDGARLVMPVAHSLDEIGALTNRYARLLARSKHMESDLAYERSFVNTVLENASALVLVQDTEGRIYRFNRACEELTGRKFEEVQGGYVWDYFLDPKEAEDVRVNTFEPLVKNPKERSGRYVNSWILPDKSRRTIDWSKSALLDTEGNTEFIVSVGIDITDKIKTEAELVRNLQLQTAQVEIARHLEMAKTYADIINAVDTRLNDALGYTSSWLYIENPESGSAEWNMVSRSNKHLDSVEQSAIVQRIRAVDSKIFSLLLEANEPVIVEDAQTDTRMNREIVEKTNLRTVVFLPLSAEGDRIGVLGVGTFGSEGIRVPGPVEITFLQTLAAQIATVCERIEYERRLNESNDDLERRVEERTRELHDAQEELVRNERLAVLGQLTATVSHELRNPLSAMRPSAYVLRKKLEADDPALLQAIDRIERSIDRCDHIIEELLDFTRAARVEKSPTNLDEWLGFVLEEQALPESIEVTFSSGLGDMKVDVDSFRLRRVLVNVLENAAQALTSEENGSTQANAKIDIRTSLVDGRVRMQIADNGPGISEEVMPHIFEPLFSTKNFGVGLGMPAVKQIMELHDGGIDVESIEGEGTTVMLWLPQSTGAQS